MPFVIRAEITEAASCQLSDLEVAEISSSYDQQWKHFYDCVRIGTRVNCTVADGRRAVELAVAAGESSITGRPITMNLSTAEETYDSHK